ncbi:MAG: ROK family protein [Chitinophagales bacterium]
MLQVTLGIDIGGTFTKIGVANRAGDVLAEDVLPTNIYKTIDPFLDILHRKSQTLLSSIDSKVDLVGIGVGAPNGNYYNGTIENAPNLNWKGIIPFKQLLSKYFDVPIVLTNDANAAAIGEMVYGGAKNMRNFLVITLGTGLGSGIVVNGQVLYGHSGLAGEFGHIIVREGGRNCNCGRKGCLETYASVTGIRRTVYKLLADSNQPSEMRAVSFEGLDARMITDAAMRGDKVAIEAFRYTGEILGLKLANAAAIFSPEAIFLFGGLVKAGKYLLNPTQHYMETNMLNIFSNTFKLLPSQLMGKNAAILGSAALVWNEIE